MRVCPERDSNPYILANATPSRWCVCQFRHPGFFEVYSLESKVLSRFHLTLDFRLKTFYLKDVPEERLELSRDNSQRLLRPQRLPISPSGPVEHLRC
jgi:hypothetical protein